MLYIKAQLLVTLKKTGCYNNREERKMTKLSSPLKKDIIPEAISYVENPHEIDLENYSDYPKNTFIPSSQNNDKKIDMDIYENNYPEIDMIEVPVVKRVVFQFNKPIELKFS